MIQVAHATSDYCCKGCVTSLYKLIMLLVIIVAEAVTSLYKLLMLLVIRVTEAVFRVYISCSCYW